MVKINIEIMNLGNAVKQLRKKGGINQMMFSASIGITQSYLSQIEKGHRKPSVEVLENIANELKIPLPVLFWFSVEEHDIDETKREAYRMIKPSLDALIGSIF